MRSAIPWTVALVGWAFVIVAETLRPVPPIAPVGPDVGSHFAGFLTLGVLAIMSLRYWQVPDGPWMAALGCMIFGTICEAGQVFVPGRSVDYWDWVANLSGAFTGIAVVCLVRALWYPRRASSDKEDVRDEEGG